MPCPRLSWPHHRTEKFPGQIFHQIEEPQPPQVSAKLQSVPAFDPHQAIGELKGAVLAILRLENVAVAHVGVAGNVDGRNAVVGRAGRARDAQRFEKAAVDVLPLLGSIEVGISEAEIVDERGAK